MTRASTIVYVQPTSEIGGSDIALYRLVTHLDRSAFRPVVVLPRDGPLGARLRQEGIDVRTIPMLQLRPTRDPAYQARFLWAYWPTVARLTSLVRRERAALVHSNALYSPYGAPAAAFARVPHVWHIREIPALPRAARAVAAAAVSALSARVIPMTDAVTSALGLRRSRKVVPIPDGIDLAAFHPERSGERVRRELDVERGAPLIGYVTRLDPWKGVEVFLRAAAAIALERDDARFLVCGGELAGYEHYAEELRTLAGELGIGARVHFTGWTYRLDDIPEVMAAIDVLLHTPIQPEPFGLVLVEAMATARPVVASAAGGILEVVDDGVTGTLVPPGDWRGMATAVLGLLADPQKARAFGLAGRARAERLYEVGAYADRVEALYADVLGSHA